MSSCSLQGFSSVAASAIGSDLEDGELTERDDLGKWGLFAGECEHETGSGRATSCTAASRVLTALGLPSKKCSRQMAAVAAHTASLQHR